ncbi:MAG: lipid-A-disaccharide synthase [Ginsengibacter sp.]
MKYYVISGEASGDLHGSNLIKEINKLDQNSDIRGWGGEKMEAEGAKVVKHYKDLAFMGFVEVIKNLPTIFKNLSFCKKDILNFQPDAIILIDYPGFNLRIAKWAKEKGFKIFYYISPQIWAWKESRVHDIKKYVDKMLVILPFEQEFYSKWDYKVDYIGHPLVEVVNDYIKTTIHDEDLKNLIALLPGSRKQELEKKLPIMLEVTKAFPEHQFVVAKAPGIENEFYDRFISSSNNVTTVSDKTYWLLNHSLAALVTSGTATLETALFGVPQVVCYKGSNLSYQIAKRVIKVKFISLVNLIMDREVVKELIQDDLTVNNITKELKLLLYDQDKIRSIKADYDALKSKLQKGGNASANGAAIIVNYLMTS